MRGRFIREDGLVLPNNISKAGAAMILAAAFRNDASTFHAALVKGVPTPTMRMGAMVEPTIGTNGYARVAIPRSAVGWPVQNEAGGERYIESDWLTWEATDSGFNQTVQRLALLAGNTYSAVEDIFALSAPLPRELQILSTTALTERRFKYQVWL